MNKILLITSPDDVLQDGFRLLLVGLTKPQTELVSDALQRLEHFSSMVVYLWNSNDDVPWLLDKKQKSDLIIFNAEHENQEIVGYMTAQPNSYFIGILKTLDIIKNQVIHDSDQCFTILQEKLISHEQASAQH